jgi:hypothetical protein
LLALLGAHHILHVSRIRVKERVFQEMWPGWKCVDRGSKNRFLWRSKLNFSFRDMKFFWTFLLLWSVRKDATSPIWELLNGCWERMRMAVGFECNYYYSSLGYSPLFESFLRRCYQATPKERKFPAITKAQGCSRISKGALNTCQHQILHYSGTSVVLFCLAVRWFLWIWKLINETALENIFCRNA